MKRDVPRWSSEPAGPAGAFNKIKQGHKVGAEKNRPGDEPLRCEEIWRTHGADWTVPAQSGNEKTSNNEIKCCFLNHWGKTTQTVKGSWLWSVNLICKESGETVSEIQLYLYLHYHFLSKVTLKTFDIY